MEVPIKKVSFPNRAAFVKATHASAVRAGLSPESANLLVAHIAASTKWGEKIDNYRVAGMKAGEVYRKSHPYTAVGGCECLPARPNQIDPACTCPPGKGQRYFKKLYWRAYNSLDEGVAAMVRQLQVEKYAQAWAYLQAVDPEYFAEVGRQGWYNADPAYLKRMMSGHLLKIAAITGVGGAKVASVGASGSGGSGGAIAVGLGIPAALAIGFLIWKG